MSAIAFVQIHFVFDLVPQQRTSPKELFCCLQLNKCLQLKLRNCWCHLATGVNNVFNINKSSLYSVIFKKYITFFIHNLDYQVFLDIAPHFSTDAMRGSKCHYLNYNIYVRHKKSLSSLYLIQTGLPLLFQTSSGFLTLR